MYQKMYADEPDNWQPVDEEDMREQLAAYYRDVDAAIEAMKDGNIRTPWAFYRCVEAS